MNKTAGQRIMLVFFFSFSFHPVEHIFVPRGMSLLFFQGVDDIALLDVSTGLLGLVEGCPLTLLLFTVSFLLFRVLLSFGNGLCWSTVCWGLARDSLCLVQAVRDHRRLRFMVDGGVTPHAYQSSSVGRFTGCVTQNQNHSSSLFACCPIQNCDTARKPR